MYYNSKVCMRLRSRRVLLRSRPLINFRFSLRASRPDMGLVSGALATATGRLRGDGGAGILSTQCQWIFGISFCSTELRTSDLRPRGS